MKNLTIINKEINFLYNLELDKEYVLGLKERKGEYKDSILVDEMFKTMFVGDSKKKNLCTLLSLIFDVSFDELYNNIQSYNSELNKEWVKDKGSRCDLVTKIYDELVHIEVNNNDSLETMQRNVHYAFVLSSDKIRSGKSYEFNPVFSINFNNFAFKGNDKVIEVYTIKGEEGYTLVNNIILRKRF